MTAWYKKAVDVIWQCGNVANTQSQQPIGTGNIGTGIIGNNSTFTRCAFVSTNSICQGDGVATLWKPLMENYGVEIDFAYRTFRWDNEAFDKAHVHCVIIGFHAKGNVANVKMLPSPNANAQLEIGNIGTGNTSTMATISKTAQAILDARARYPESSLADLYDPLTMPHDLRAAHEANDKAVLAAYGLAPDTPEMDIVAHLFKLYAEKVKA